MPPTKLVISQPTTVLPPCTPNLMPFHINYSGPAAVSAFMRVKKLAVEELEREGNEAEATTEDLGAAKTGQDATKDIEMASDAQPDSSTTRLNADVGPKATPLSGVISESQTTIVASESQTSSFLSSSSSLATLAPTPTPLPSIPPLEDADKRVVSTFRGRTIHGLTIDLPAGFSGLVLQTESRSQGISKVSGAAADDKTNAKGKAKKSNGASGNEKEEEQDAPSTRRRGRLTRSALVSSKPTKPTEIPDDDQDEVMADATGESSTTPKDKVGADDDTASARRLVPTAQFSAFTLWQADRVVDKGRDEYYRSLTEWVALANEIHCVD